jgi:transposase
MAPFMPKDQPGPERKDDRQIISGILHVLTSGRRWRDCPSVWTSHDGLQPLQPLVPAWLLEGDVGGLGQSGMVR